LRPSSREILRPALAESLARTLIFPTNGYFDPHRARFG
jgi:hypothetical protein